MSIKFYVHVREDSSTALKSTENEYDCEFTYYSRDEGWLDKRLVSHQLSLWAEHLGEKATRSEAIYKKKATKRRGRNHKHNFSNKYNRKGQQKAYKKEWHRAVRQMKRWSDDKRVSTKRSELNWGGL